MTAPHRRHRLARAALIFVGLFVLYNLNGREIGTADSQPAKYTAREVAVLGTLALDRVVLERPGLGDRPAFARARDGHVRSAYPWPSGVIAAVPAFLLHRSGLVNMDAPLAPNLVAKVTASVLTALAVALLFSALTRVVTTTIAVWTAVALGVGTNYWALVSQTLWQHEVVACGLCLALWAYVRPDATIAWRHHVAAGIGLALAGAARPQTTPLVVAMLFWSAARLGPRRLWPAAAVVGVVGAATMTSNVLWFGHVLGATPSLEALHPSVHAVGGSLSATPWIGAAGLLISPSRGLLVFSPVVVAAVMGWRDRPPALRLGWLAAGAAVQFAAYACYSVWWAGHTFGPRYALDLLPVLAVFGALGLARLWPHRWPRRMLALGLAWSVAVSALGAFVFPNEQWNTRPADVDRHHGRLWERGDSQIARAARSAASPQNFNLWSREAVAAAGPTVGRE